MVLPSAPQSSAGDYLEPARQRRLDSGAVAVGEDRPSACAGKVRDAFPHDIEEEVQEEEEEQEKPKLA